MANNSTLFTITPSIPNDLLCGLEGHLLMAILGHENDGNDTTYFYCEEAVENYVPVDDDLIALVESGTGPIADKLKALDIENKSDDLDLEGDVGVDVTNLLQVLVASHPDQLPRIEVQGCWTCSKMRPGEFGGFAYVITPSGIESIDTSQWLAKSSALTRAA